MIRYVDRTGWDHGPWDREPDAEFWREGDYYGFALRNPERGTWCGYAAVPPGHPQWGASADATGLQGPREYTFAGRASDLPEHFNLGQGAEGYWAFGFHCAYGHDDWPGVRQFGDFPRLLKYRKLSYVKGLVQETIAQLRAGSQENRNTGAVRFKARSNAAGQ